MMDSRVKYCLLAFAATISVYGCSPVNPLEPVQIKKDVRLSAYRSHILTRAGEQTTEFETETKYSLFIKDNSGWLVKAYEKNAAVETSDHTIDYGNPIPFGASPIDFYGVTYGSEVTPEITFGQDETTLSVRLDATTDGVLPDLMHSRLTGRTAEGGTILEMDFRHAFSKLNIQVLKQDESDDAIKQLEDARITEIAIEGTHTEGSFDFINEIWNYNENTISGRTYYDDDEGVELSTRPMPLFPGNDQTREFYIFPNKDDEQVSIRVKVSGFTNENGDPQKEEVERIYNIQRIDDNTGTNYGIFKFEPNHEYTLVITILKDDVRTIAIAPQKYEWIEHDIDMGDVNQGADAYMGQPITFGNQMWMDRNLGAQSADCDNDWWNCRGYYYQYGRNIPFILDMDKYDLAVTSTQEGGLHLMAFYTYNEKGERIYGGFEANNTSKLPNTPIPEGCAATPEGIPVRHPNVAMNPGEQSTDNHPLIYNFIYDRGNGIWLYNENGSGEATIVNQMWTGSTENHPCPKGWRLPTKEDFAAFIPDKSLSAPWNTRFHEPIFYDGSISHRREHLCYGKIGNESAIYIIKNQGQENCYRIKITLKETKSPDYTDSDGNTISSDGKYYYECAYYSGDSSMTFEGLDTEDKFLNSGLDWSLPSATMQIPACGFIHPQGGLFLNGDGINAILRTTDYSGAGTNWVCYLRNDGWTFGLQNSSRKALGDQIRCIRNVEAF